jgi:hypothetical protein
MSERSTLRVSVQIGVDRGKYSRRICSARSDPCPRISNSQREIFRMMNMKGIAFCCRALMPYIEWIPRSNSALPFHIQINHWSIRVCPRLTLLQTARLRLVAKRPNALSQRYCSTMSAVGPDCLAGSRGRFGEAVAPSP